MITSFIGALTLTAKLGICIALFALLIAAEILALLMLIKWKKNYKTLGVRKDADEADLAASQDAQTESAAAEDNQEENTQEAEYAAADENADDNTTMFAFAPLFMLSAALQVATLRYLLYALIGVSVALGAVVFIVAIAFSKSLTKEPKQKEDKKSAPVELQEEIEEEQQTQEAAEIVEAVEEQEAATEDTQPIEEEQESDGAEEVEEQESDEAVEEEEAAEDAEETSESLEEDEPQYEQEEQENIAAEEDEPIDEITIDVADEAEGNEDTQTQVAEEPIAEEKPKREAVKREPPARERTIIVDNIPMLIKDDRFLFNANDEGYYEVLEKTFTARIIQSEEYVKDYYTELKNELLSYKKVHARMSKKRESFNFGRTCLARLTMRGKTLRLHLALDAQDYDDTKYKVEDKSDVKSLADTPLMYRMKNDRRVKYAKDLIAAVMAKYGVKKQEIEPVPVDYTSMYPYEPTEDLIARGLIIRKRYKLRGFDFAQKSFMAKLIQSEDVVKEYYSQLKNHLLSYKKVHDRMSKKRESFRFGRVCVARMAIRGKTLRLCLALNAADYEDTKYKVEDVSDVKSLVDTPLLIKIKNNRRVKYAKELIDVAMVKVGALINLGADETDYVAELPYEETEALYERGLIVDRHVEGNSFLAQHFAPSNRNKVSEAAADEDED